MKLSRCLIFAIAASMAATSMICSCSGSSKDKSSESRHEKVVEQEKHESDGDSGATWQEDIPTVIDFYATWCGPCKMIAPLFDQLKTKYDGRMNFVRVDVDEESEQAERYRIEAMPTFVFLDKDGNEIARIVGADSEALTAKVKELAAKD